MIRGDSLSSRDRDHFDWPLFIAAVSIAVLGVVNLYSATSVYSGARAELYISQVYWLFMGGIIGGVLIALDYRHLERLGYVLYTFGVFSLALVFVLARDVRGSARWIEFGAFRFQPSEFTKVFLVIALAKFLHDDPRNEGRTLRDLAIPAALTAVPALLVLKQPDLGTALILVFVFLTIAAVTRVRWRSVGAVRRVHRGGDPDRLGVRAARLPAARVLVFLHPEEDLLHRGWHAHHSRVAIGNGGLFGSGYLQGHPEPVPLPAGSVHGLPVPRLRRGVGVHRVHGPRVPLCIPGRVGIRIASMAKDRFGAVLGVGCAAIIFWHAVINLGMTSGVLPVVGVTLPLFSYGGSSVTTVMVAIALLMSVSMRRYSGVASLDRL